jgi:ribosomal protein S18 acetylase RimI-like enzyme
MEVREFYSGDLEGIKKIFQDLHPKWFDDQAMINIPIDVKLQKTYVADNDKTIVGFICLRSQDGKPYIGWMGVSPSLHNRGIGKKLLNQAEKELLEAGANTLRVETVVEQNPNDESYNNTVKFYEACGFKVESMSEPKQFEKFVYRMGTMLKELRK